MRDKHIENNKIEQARKELSILESKERFYWKKKGFANVSVSMTPSKANVYVTGYLADLIDEVFDQHKGNIDSALMAWAKIQQYKGSYDSALMAWVKIQPAGKTDYIFIIREQKL